MFLTSHIPILLVPSFCCPLLFVLFSCDKLSFILCFFPISFAVLKMLLSPSFTSSSHASLPLSTLKSCSCVYRFITVLICSFPCFPVVILVLIPVSFLYSLFLALHRSLLLLLFEVPCLLLPLFFHFIAIIFLLFRRLQFLQYLTSEIMAAGHSTKIEKHQHAILEESSK